MASQPGASRGFTLVELLVVIAIVGLLAAMAVSSLTSAIQRGRQKRTMGDMHTLGAAIQAYQIDFARFPAVTGNASQLTAVLTPTYLKTLPAVDGWNRPIQYAGGPTGYTLISWAADGTPTTPYRFGPTTAFSDDIVFVDGQFAQWPEGMQASR